MTLSKWKDSIRLMCAVFVCPLVTAARANPNEECVGRYQIALPSEADIATTAPSVFRQKYVEHPVQFNDGQPAVLSSFWLDGEFEIASGMALSDYIALRKSVKDSLDKAGRSNEDLVRTEMPTDRSDTYAYFGAASSGLIQYESNQIVTFETRSYGYDVATGKLKVQAALDGLKYRKAYETPKGDGVCFPGIFVMTKGKEHREIATMFRLKAHPDVTVLFKDKTSQRPIQMVDVHNMPIGRRTRLTSREQNEFIWMYSGLGTEVKLAHDPIPFRTVTLDGRKGVGSFGTITRGDGSTDYGYLVTVQGDPDAAVDTPDLMLLVERTGKNAKGNTPVTPEELKAIAKDIAASIKRRPVQ